MRHRENKFCPIKAEYSISSVFACTAAAAVLQWISSKKPFSRTSMCFVEHSPEEETNSMSAITVRGVTLLPPQDVTPANFKILIPVMANDLSNAAAAGAAGDVVELRLDALPMLDIPEVKNALHAVRAAIGDAVPLLATIRTKKEGGLADITDAQYGSLCAAICGSGLADLLDVEASTAPEVKKAVQQCAAQAGVKTVFSRHNFQQTPPVETMVQTLTDMVRQGADVAKLAVMPQTPADTARLLEATAQAAQATANAAPLITMSMGQMGVVSRICGAAFGSCAGFATAGVSSAPGQPTAAALHTALDALDYAMK